MPESHTVTLRGYLGMVSLSWLRVENFIVELAECLSALSLVKMGQLRLLAGLVVFVLLGSVLQQQLVQAAENEGVGRSLKYFKSMSFGRNQVHGVVTTTKVGNEVQQPGFSVNLMRRDPHKSQAVRLVEAVQRSHDRAAYYTQKLSPSAFGSQEFQSPVKAGSGEYLMTLAIGSPPQSFDVIVDTGSDLNWVQCLPCRVCYQQPGPKFDPTKSTSFRTSPCADSLCTALPLKACAANVCQYQYTYGDQSTTNGDLAFETISFSGAGTETVPNFAFGCGTKNLGTFAGAAGLVGLGKGPLSLTSQLSPTVAKKFSYCLVSLDSAATSVLTFGSVAASERVQYTPIVENSKHGTYYYVQLDSIEVGGQPLNLDKSIFAIDQSTGRGGTIIDSGTTITMLTMPAYNAVLKAYQSFVTYPLVDGSAYGLDMCFNVAGVAAPRVPTMTFKFQGADYELLAENLFVLVDVSATTLCLAMGGSQGFSIIGNIQQQNHLVIYDMEAKQIGFAVANC